MDSFKVASEDAEKISNENGKKRSFNLSVYVGRFDVRYERYTSTHSVQGKLYCEWVIKKYGVISVSEEFSKKSVGIFS